MSHFRSLGQTVSDEEVQDMLLEVDADGNGEIDFDEYVDLMVKKLQDTDPKVELLEIFKIFDRDGDGFISAADLKEILTILGMVISDAEIRLLIVGAEADGDGFVNFEEFFKIMNFN